MTVELRAEQRAEQRAEKKGEIKDLFADVFDAGESLESSKSSRLNPARIAPRSSQTASFKPGSKASSKTSSKTSLGKVSGSPRKNRARSVRVDHMAATRRLRWKLRRAQSHSPEEVKAGRLICRHLLAMLDEAELNKAALSQRSNNDSHYSSNSSSNLVAGSAS